MEEFAASLEILRHMTACKTGKRETEKRERRGKGAEGGGGVLDLVCVKLVVSEEIVPGTEIPYPRKWEKRETTPSPPE